jgi:hypothetical protein
MPLPLIPVLAMFVAAGGGGVVTGADGMRRMSLARSRCRAAERSRDQVAGELEEATARVGLLVRDYGMLQTQVQADTIGAFARWLEDNQRKVRRLEGQIVDGIEVQPIDLPRLQVQARKTQHLLRGGVSAALTGMAARHAALTGIRATATASTGAAISALNGAAANSATLAWLGGGTLASGGGGMAAGASTLTGIGVAPALLITGLSLNIQGHHALTRARRLEADTAIEIAHLHATKDLLGSVASRIDEMSAVLVQLDERARASLVQLSALDFDPDRDVHAFMRVAQLVQALREILNTRILDEEGNTTPESSQIVIKYAA